MTDKSKYADCFTRDDIKAELQADLIIILDDNGYPPVAIDDAYKEVLEQAENFKKHREKTVKVKKCFHGFLN